MTSATARVTARDDAERPTAQRPRRLVAHYTDGRVLKGVSEDFGIDEASFTLRLLGKNERVCVWLRELKAVFFVKYFDGRPYHRSRAKARPEIAEGVRQRVDVLFADGESLSGWAQTPPNGDDGFYMVPADPECNNALVWVVRGPGVTSITVQPSPPPI